MQLCVQQADVRRLQERCRVAEGHVKLLKQHVQRSDDRYACAKQQLDALKSDVVEMARAAPKAPQHSAATPLSARRHTSANGSTTPLSGAPQRSLCSLCLLACSPQHSTATLFSACCHTAANRSATLLSGAALPVQSQRSLCLPLRLLFACYSMLVGYL